MDIELLLVVVAERPLEAARPPSEWSFQVPPRLLTTPREIDPWPRGAGWVDTLHEMGSGAVLFLSVTSTPTPSPPSLCCWVACSSAHSPARRTLPYHGGSRTRPDPTQPCGCGCAAVRADSSAHPPAVVLPGRHERAIRSLVLVPNAQTGGRFRHVHVPVPIQAGVGIYYYFPKWHRVSTGGDRRWLPRAIQSSGKDTGADPSH